MSFFLLSERRGYYQQGKNMQSSHRTWSDLLKFTQEAWKVDEDDYNPLPPVSSVIPNSVSVTTVSEVVTVCAFWKGRICPIILSREKHETPQCALIYSPVCKVIVYAETDTVVIRFNRIRTPWCLACTVIVQMLTEGAF